jgi:AcrR family transcriptional regulator
VTSVIANPAAPITARICTAFLACIERDGLRATSLDDVAIEAGCGRATIYRVIAGGRAGLLLATVGHSLGIVISGCREAVSGAETLEDAVARSLQTAASLLGASVALERLLAEEPGAIWPFISFDGLQPLLDRVAEFSPALFGRFGSDEQSRAAGEWVARVVLGHLRSPGGPVDLTDLDHCRRLVAGFFTTNNVSTTSQPSDIIR